jgi:thioredoxin reductase (NADPH)
MIYDTIILGGGPAGLTAAIYAGRYNMKTLVIADNFGGTANLAGELENWPGYIGPGMQLMATIKEQAEKFGAELITGNVQEIKKDNNEFILNYNESETAKGKTIIVALGTKHRKLGIPGEKEFLGKGVSYCATCDGNFFRNKKVAVIGGNDSAAKAALYLADICEKVTIVYRKDKLRCEPIYLEKIEKNEKIEIIYNSNPKEIIGETLVKELKIESEGKESSIEVSGVFIEVGATPATELVKDLKLELENNYIKTDKHTKTNIPGVFAAGDITNSAMKQMITASGEGAIAAHSAQNFILNKK